ncbi:hypothetical protein PFISCL1PPCAC_23119, partial [Pristionchus fissidentatus]
CMLCFENGKKIDLSHKLRYSRSEIKDQRSQLALLFPLLFSVHARVGAGNPAVVALGLTHKRAPITMVRVLADLVHVQHGRHARELTLEYLRPLISALFLEDALELLNDLGGFRVHLLQGEARQAGNLQHVLRELGLQAAHTHVLAVLGLVAAVDGALGAESSERHRPQVVNILVHGDEGGEVGETLRHRHVQYRALAAIGGALEERGDDAECRREGAASEVAQQVGRRPGRHGARASYGRQHTRYGGVVDVVTGLLRQRAVLTEPGEPAHDQARVRLKQLHRVESELLQHAGSVGVQKNVGSAAHVSDPLDALCGLEIDLDHLLAAIQPLLHHLTALIKHGNVGAKVGQHHAAMRNRRETRELEYGNAL